MAKQKLSKEEKKRIRKEQRQKDALHSFRCRGFKNFLFWLTGVLTSVVLIITTLFIGVGVVPVRVYLGDNVDGVISDDVSSKSLINAILKANTYDMSDFPVVADALDDLIKNANLNQYVEIDVEKIKTLKFDDTFAAELQSCIKVVATLESVGGTDLIGDVGNLQVFSNWEEVETENLPEVDNDGNIAKDQQSGELTSNPKLYYYYHVESEGPSLMSAKPLESEGKWVRAFDDNGNRVPESIGQPLYYANLSQVPILDVLDLIDESLGRLKLTDLLETFGGADLSGASLVGDLLGNKTISQIGDISTSDIFITTFLPYKDEANDVDNSQIYKILLQVCGAEISDWNDDATVKAAAESLNIDSFNNLKLENLTISTFLPYKDEANNVDNSQMYKILLQLCGAEINDWSDEAAVKAAAESLNVNSFNNLNFENLTISTFLPYKDEANNVDNSQMYKILLQLCDVKIENWDDEDEVKQKAESLNINSFGNLNFENIGLSTFLSYEGNEDLYKVLLQLCGIEFTDDNVAEKAKELTIDSFSNISFENIGLSTFLTYEGNEDLYKVLLQLCGIEFTDDNVAEKAKELTIDSFSNISFENVGLSAFLPYEDNEDLYKVLLQLCDATIENWDDEAEVKAAAENLSIDSFSNLNFENITLSTVIPYQKDDNGTMVPVNTELYNILLDVINGDKDTDDATYIDKGEIKISHLSSFEFENIKLDTVLPANTSDNQALYDMLSDMLNKDAESITISDLSKIKFDDVKLDSILPVDKVENGVKVNENLYKVLVDALGGTKTAQNITISDLSKFEFDNIKFSTIMPKTNDNSAL